MSRHKKTLLSSGPTLAGGIIILYAAPIKRLAAAIIRLSFSLSVFIGCGPILQNKGEPLAIKGVLDLSDWDFERDGPVTLSGEYEFYWQQHLAPENFSHAPRPKLNSFMPVPAAWNDHELNGTKLPGAGYATYRLTVLLKDSIARELALKFFDMGTAYAVFVNGNKILSIGRAGVTPETTVPKYWPQIVDFALNANHIELIYQVSNFHHHRGGAWELIYLGTDEQLNNIREKRLALDLILFGSILAMGLYHLSLFGLRKKDQSSLFFGLFCLMVAVRLLTTVERYLLHIFPGISWEWFVKVEYLSAYLSVPVFALFLYKLFPPDFHKIIVAAMSAVGLLFSGMVCLTPARIFTPTLRLYQLFMIGCMVYGLSMLVLCAARKREGAAILMIGLLFLFATLINDILDANGIIQSGHFVHLGMFIFIFAHAFMLSARYSRSFRAVDLQRGELEKSNIQYQQEVRERQQTEEALRDSEERFRQLAENIGEVFWLGNPEKDKIIYISPGYERIWGRTCESLYASPQNWLQAIHPEDRDRVLEAALTKQVSGQYDETYRIHQLEGSIRWIRDRAFPIRDKTGAIYRIAGTAEDITERKQAEEALRASETRFRMLVETMNEGLVQNNANFIPTYVNEKLCQMSGYAKEEVLGVPPDGFYDETNRQTLQAQKALRWQGLEQPYEIEIKCKDGRNLPVIVSPKALLDNEGNFAGSFAVVTDITEQKRAEQTLKKYSQELEDRSAKLKTSNEKLVQEIQERERAERELKHSRAELRNLSAHLEYLREEERARMAREIHDELGQVLSTLKMDLGTLENHFPKDKKILFEITHSMAELIYLTIQRVKRISQELRPSVLDHLTFSQAVTWQIDEFMKKTGISCQLSIKDADNLHLTRNASNALFRVLQEALTNVMRHAEATMVSVGLEKTDAHVMLKIQDNGKGFTKQEMADPQSFGLIGMRERIHHLDGNIEISSGINQGTTIVCTIPHKPDEPQPKKINTEKTE